MFTVRLYKFLIEPHPHAYHVDEHVRERRDPKWSKNTVLFQLGILKLSNENAQFPWIQLYTEIDSSDKLEKFIFTVKCEYKFPSLFRCGL